MVNIKRIAAAAMILALVFALFGCGAITDMPFNGQVEFHKISITIPENYVRDSTQSTEDVWIFERGFYDAYIILSRSDLGGDTAAEIQDYVDYMQEQGVDSVVTTFLEKPAVHSTYTKDGLYCQEMLFAYEGSFYAVALRGGDEDEFQALLETVKFNEVTL